MQRDVHEPILFEVAWEVANKVGGIYTVIKTKSPVTADEYGSRYYLIGPLSTKSADLEVERLDIERACEPVKEALYAMREQGINFVYGRWLIEGYPTVILFDVHGTMYRLNEWKKDLWEKAGIPSPTDDFEMNDSIVFGYLVAWFLGECVHRERKAALIAHFHEWLAGVGLVLCRNRGLEICTIFTTHATLLGRYLCAGDADFYNHLKYFDVDVEAGKRGIYHRYCLERAAAHCADVFTTVSHITAFEAENLLKRKPDGVLPNGLNVVKFSAMHEFQNLHAKNKEKIHDFVRGHFYGHFDFDLDNTLYFFSAGRYEFRNKGIDMYLEALARLNNSLKHFNSPMTVVAFIIMPAANNSYTVETLKGQAVTKQLNETVNEIESKIGQRMFHSAVRGHIPDPKDLFSEQDLVLLKRRIFALKRDCLPPIVTHNMKDDSNDPILKEIRRLGLFNHPSDRVKVIFHPEFLNSNNPVLPLDYEDFVRGCHLGVFPSYYEPWGYTPAECTVMGVPSITTNLSGFGCFIEESVENPSDYGLYIIDRRMKSVEDSVQQLTDTMLQFCQKTRRQRIILRNRTERLSDILDWNRMGLEYVKARELALHRKYPELFEDSDDEIDHSVQKIPRPLSTPSSPKLKSTFTTEQLAEQLSNELQELQTKV
ncbi:glycogen synthase [Rozella allomycis CSF55]|uniref:Glycogen [starch] synthase n=1 Tax=Rozella allomycis (strain CSF55) TaxID=988480 RepID=A0A4P9YHC7_ROZAC|nr:glycogen synthase [Rozella allomycis CSF55]